MDNSIVMKGCIQIWDVGVVSMETTALSTPHLSLTIAHEFGVVREMKWCPSGCHEEDEREREGEEMEGEGDEKMEEGTVGTRSEEGGEKLRRLGLLAVASSDGYVRILRLVK